MREDNCFKKVDTEASEGLAITIYQITTIVFVKLSIKELSLQQPPPFTDGYGWTSDNGCNIDNDSKLRNARNLTDEREINQLLTRPSAVPYMGRGVGNVCEESNLRTGEDTFQNRPCNNLAESMLDQICTTN